MATPEVTSTLSAVAHTRNGFVPHPATPLQVFIVGGPRSGTSVLTRAMRLVFDLPGHGESHVIPAAAMVTHPLRRYLERFQGNQQDLLVKGLSIDRVEDMVFDYIRGFYTNAYDGESWVDKTPSDEALHSVALIPRIFPKARVIVTRRNGIEVVQSSRAKFRMTFEDACLNWASVMAGVELARKRIPGALETDQRDFISDTDAFATACSQHLGRPERAGDLAAFLRSDRQDQTSASPGILPTTLADTHWTGEEMATFRRVCGHWMDAFGYEMERTLPANASRSDGRRLRRLQPSAKGGARTPPPESALA